MSLSDGGRGNLVLTLTLWVHGGSYVSEKKEGN